MDVSEIDRFMSLPPNEEMSKTKWNSDIEVLRENLLKKYRSYRKVVNHNKVEPHQLAKFLTPNVNHRNS